MSGELELLKALNALKKKDEESFAEKFKPYEPQLQFLSSVKSSVCLFGGNRCLSGDTLIYDPVAGANVRLDTQEESFHVEAWDGEKRVTAKAGVPFKKDMGDLYRVYLENGSHFDCSRDHLILASGGWLPAHEGLSLCEPSHLQTTSGTSPSVLYEDVRHCSQKALDSLGDYHRSLRLCGEQPRTMTGVCQGDAPLPDGVQGHTHSGTFGPCPNGEPYRPLDHSRLPKLDDSHSDQPGHRPSTQGAPDLIEVPYVDSERQISCTLSIPVWDLFPPDAPLSGHGSILPQPNDEDHQWATCTLDLASVAASSCYLPSVKIVRIEYLRKDFLWDFDVEGYSNYILCGVVHHNSGKSHVGSYAVMCHVTGDYPSWWRGVRFAGPIEVWVVGVTSLRVRDTIQQKLFGKLGRMGTGMIPKSKIIESSIIKKTGTPMAIDRVEIKHVSGETSIIQFFSYEMDREKFQGSSVNLVWFDEEPPKDIYEECKMRVLDTRGNILFTFTPLSGTTPLIEDILADPNIEKIWLTMDDAKHLREEDINRLLEGMSEADKKARRMGIAGTGEGKIFNFMESDYTIEPFEIPAYWRRIGALDVGLTHPTGAICAAIDDDSDTIYVYKEYRVQNKTAFEHAAHLKHWGVKFLIDPSAFNRQIGTGQSTAAIYQDEGLDLIKANNSVDASIIEIRRLIGSGRLFIFNNLDMLLRELRMYRTKKTSDGNAKIVKEEDDLIDPLRYLCMGIGEHADRPKRFQRPPEVIRFKAADKKVGY